MKRLCVMAMLALAASCGGEDAPKTIRAIPENAADFDITGIEATEIVPGLQSRVLLKGEGPEAESGDTAVVHYTGWLYDENAPKHRGSKFDSSVDRDELFPFPLGAGRVIKGWDQGVVGMRVGEVRELTISPELAYGDRGAGDVIPPGATLVFVVQLVDLQRPQTDAEP